MAPIDWKLCRSSTASSQQGAEPLSQEMDDENHHTEDMTERDNDATHGRVPSALLLDSAAFGADPGLALPRDTEQLVEIRRAMTSGQPSRTSKMEAAEKRESASNFRASWLPSPSAGLATDHPCMSMENKSWMKVTI
jgi:hypothetical protein